MKRQIHLLLAVAALWVAGSGGAAEPVIRLPEFVVTDSRLLPPAEAWRYAQVPGFEVLSNATDRTTRRVVRDLLQFHQAIWLVWPAILPKPGEPAGLILCARRGKFAEFVPGNAAGGGAGTISLALRDREEAAIVLDLEDKILDVDPTGTDTEGRGVAVDAFKQLHREYVHFLLGRANPRPAPWLEEGLAQLMSSMDYDGREIVVGRLPDANAVSPEEAQAAEMDTGDPDGASTVPGHPPPVEEKAFDAALARRRLMPLEAMFAMGRDAPEARRAVGGLWSNQCWLFVHLCLYGEGGKFTKAFFEFANRSEREPVTEALFRQCFKMGYASMLGEFRDYMRSSDYRFTRFKAHRGSFPEVAEANLRDASEAEVGRIKGAALRMAGRAAAAHLTLIAPYLRGSRDPDLLAAIGLDEYAAGAEPRAASFLEEAIRRKTGQARAYLALGQIRLARAKAKPDGEGGKLGNGQLDHILAPLFAGLTVPPRLRESYETIAQAWLAAEARPTQRHLGVVSEGVRIFWRDTDLIYLDAVLHARNGFRQDTVVLVKLGEEVAADDADRARFRKLAAALPAE